MVAAAAAHCVAAAASQRHGHAAECLGALGNEKKGRLCFLPDHCHTNTQL